MPQTTPPTTKTATEVRRIQVLAEWAVWAATRPLIHGLVEWAVQCMEVWEAMVEVMAPCTVVWAEWEACMAAWDSRA